METVAEIQISDALMEKYRYINVEYDRWYEGVYFDFTQDMLDNYGIDVTEMHFSGFCSQGDGACFEGRVRDWDVFLKKLGYDSPVLTRFAKDTWRFSVKHSGRYYHENCTSFDADTPNPDGCSADWFIERFCIHNDPNDLRGKAELAVLRTFDYEKLEDACVEMFKDNMRDLYRKLEEEHDFFTSDEAVREAIIANDLFETNEGE